ncbi:MAG: FtsX-like permease family protein, partial [Promicromonosporaceae bacterium]|nr:FtsX-like permease family protein [Promicromonosporaceae bacterium]
GNPGGGGGVPGDRPPPPGGAPSPPIEVQAGEYVRELNREAVAEIVGMIGTFMTLFAGLALFIGGFIIANTFTMSVQQQVQELALLRTMGASPAQVFGSIMLRASAVGLLGSLIGVAAGAGLLALITSALEGMGMELGSSALIDPGTAVTALVAGVLVTVLAALLPARRAAAVPPLEAMRAEGTTAAKPLRKRAIIGGAITALAAICLVTAWAWPETEAAEPALLVGALLALVGALVLMSVIAGRVTAFLAAPFVALLRPMGRLARGNVQRNPRRTAATGGALMIGSALLGLVSVLITSIGASALASVDEEVHADLVMTVPGFVPQAPAGGLAAVSALPGVEQVHSAPGTFAALVGQDGEANPVMVLGLYSNELLRPQLEQGEFGPSGWLADGEVIINSHHYHFHEYGLAVGDTLTLRGPAGEQEVTLVGVFAEGVFNLPVMANQNTLATLAPAQLWMDGPLAIRVAPGFDVADVQAAAQEAVEPYFVFSIHTRQEFIDSFRAGIDQILTVFYALLGLSLLIAGIGVINTMAMSVMERTREIGLLRAVGLGRGQLRLTVTIESVLTALFGTLLGLGLGVGIALLFPRVLGELGLSAANVPWGNLGVMLIVAVVVGVLAAAWPARRAARLPVLDAISHA